MRYLLILLLFATQAYAGGNPKPPEHENTQSQDMSQTQETVQGQDQTQQQSLIGGDNSATGGNAEATGGSAEATGGTAAAQGGDGGNVGDVTTSINYKRPYRNAPNAYAPPVYPTVNCFKGASGAASAPGFGLSLGAGKIDKGCVRRELIRLAPPSHQLFLFCKEPTVTEMFGSFQNCMKHNPPEEVLPVPEPEAYDDTALSQQIQAMVARLSAVEDISKETTVIARESREVAVAAYQSKFEAVRDELRMIQRVEK